MKNGKRYIAAFLSLAAVLALFFPLTGGKNASTGVQMLSVWKGTEVILAAWLIILALALTVTVFLDCFGSGKNSLAVALVLRTVSLVSITVLVCIWSGKFDAGAGCIGMLLCLLAGAGLEVMELVQIRQKSGSGDTRMPASEPEEKSFGQQTSGTPPCQGMLQIGCGIYCGSTIVLDHMVSLKIGRDASVSHLVIDEPAVSRSHCVVTYNAVNNSYLLLDLSSNGTYLESGQRIPKNYAMELKPGLKFYIGVPENWFLLGEKTREAIL